MVRDPEKSYPILGGTYLSSYLAHIWECPSGSFSAVLWVVTQRSSPQTAAENRTTFLFPLWGGVLRDDPKNGC